ncbi:hypothetical protein [Flaviaesturariibacter terrae]
MSLKNLLRIGAITFALLLGLAALFYKERAVFLDISFHLFRILHDDSLAIQNNRFAAFFTQLFPLLGARAGLSLAAITLLYSLSFVLLPALVFFVIASWLKNTRVAGAYLLFLVLMTTHSFYWIQSELPQGAAFFFLFLALLDRARAGDRIPEHFLFAAPVLLLTVGFAHPLLLFPFAFVLLFLCIGTGRRGLLYSLLGAGLAIFAIKSLLLGNSYDQDKMSGFGNIVSRFPDYFSMPANARLLRYFIHDYYFVPVGLGGCLYFYGSRGAWRKAALQAAFFFGYAFLVNISYPEGGDQFYFENMYLPLAIIVAVPLAYDVLPAIPSPRVQAGLIATVCFVCVLRVYETHQLYTARLNWHRELLAANAKSAEKKWIIPAGGWPKDTLLQSWGTPYEFWLLSTIECGRSASIIAEDYPGEFDWISGPNKVFFGKWGQFDYGSFDPRYFRFADTVGIYRKRP